MGIKVYNVGGGGSDWQSALGTVIGAYLGDRLGQRFTDRANDEFRKRNNQFDLDAEVSKAADLDFMNMSAQDAITNRKQKYMDLDNKINALQNSMQLVNPQGNNLYHSALQNQINEYRNQQNKYHQDAEQIRNIANRKGIDLTGYTANDVMRNEKVAPNESNMLTPLDFGVDVDSFKQALATKLQKKHDEEQIRNFDYDNFMALADEVSRGLPLGRKEEFIKQKELEAKRFAKLKENILLAEQQQAVANALASRNPVLGQLAAVGAFDSTDALIKAAQYQPKTDKIDLGGELVYSYGADRPQQVFKKTYSPDNIVSMRNNQLTNATSRQNNINNNNTSLQRTQMNNDTSLRMNTNNNVVRKELAQMKNSDNINSTKQTNSLTPELEMQIGNQVFSYVQNGKTLDEMVKDLEKSNVSDEVIETARRFYSEYTGN